MVRAKKFLGQHFLHDRQIAQRIVEALPVAPDVPILEIGPGTGMLTQYLINRNGQPLTVVEIDRESVAYLKVHFPNLPVIEGDVLNMDLRQTYKGKFMVIGNFPYNISSQIFFKLLGHRQQVSIIVCMLQWEVAARLASGPGNKTYGILSVLLQAYFDIDLLFKVSPGAFNPPPKVMSAVIRLTRNNREHMDCDEGFFVTVVKQGFNNRRKTLRNALKKLILPAEIIDLPLLDKRAEQLSVDDFIHLTGLIEKSRAKTD